ncbi:mediator of RNA polymerase II transcription subunit 26 isoform X1 [Folsomia candida]|uniref:mediator of RNA polymerase II transcription subunit 26 isoform X1 n=2 Tax=Folsomia candida TaxID=158441 RepID=UPI000B900976|nr:mediator of RNA polymerase II transcription subunit 26 isoform X1 [Folsomia candida]
MQQSPVILTQRLIDAVDDSYHVKDMGAIIEVLETLEQLPVTKELLETTRLGKTINVFRKRINDEKLAKRAKNLVKKWRDAVLVNEQQQSGGGGGGRPVNGNSDGLHVPGGHLRSIGGYNSNSSSPQLMTASRISPNALHNSNSLSPRILNNLTSNNNNRNGQQQQQVGRSSIPSAVVAAVSSPRLHSSSPSLRVSSPSQFGNKAKSPSCGPIISSSPLNNNNNTNKMMTSTNSYAPNVEVVARTNAANKRLRIEDGAERMNAGPPSKKARHGIANGGIFEGTLDDPSLALLDDLSKDSMTSRASDNSDGSSSKAVSNMSSSAVLSGAPSPASIILGDSALTSPAMSGGEGESASETLLCGQDDNKPSLFSSIPENEGSAVDHGANNVNDQPQVNVVAEVVAPVQKRGRKKKQKTNEMDAQTLRIHKQIAQAKQESMVRTVHRLSMEIFDDDHRFPPTPDISPVPPPPPLERKPIPKPHITAALSRDDPVMKSDFVKEYLHSQNKQIERQRNEISLLPHEPTPPPPPVIPPTADEPLDSKKKRKRDKKKNRGENNATTTISFPTESEILSRLPPIDPQTLEELKNFKFDVPSEDEEAKSKPEIETENATSLTSTNESNAENIKNNIAEAAPPLIASKIDWGDSEDEDDFVDVSPKIEDTSGPDDPSTIPQIVVSSTTLPQTIDEMDTSEQAEDQEQPEADAPAPREIDDSEVERLHLEKIGNLNGNLDKDGLFKEWQEVVAVESFKGDLLHILPYTIIDF